MQYVPKISRYRAGLKKLKRKCSKDFPAQMPRADFVVVTWTNAAAAIVDHTFFHPESSFLPDVYSWKKRWQRFSLGLEEYAREIDLQGEIEDSRSWCYFTLAKLGKKRVLIVKPNIHLHEHKDVTFSFFQDLLSFVAPRRALSVEAGFGCRVTHHPGDVVLSTSAVVNEETVVSGHWNDPIERLKDIEKQLSSPQITKELIHDIAYRIHAKSDTIMTKQMFARNPHPKLFALLKSPLFCSHEIFAATNDRAHEEFAAVASENYPFLLAAQRLQIPALGVVSIASPWGSRDLAMERRVALSSILAFHNAPMALRNAALVTYKLLSQSL